MPLIHDKRLAEAPPAFTVLRSFFARFDALQILPMLALLAAGVLFIYGTGQQVGGVYAEFWQRQLVWIGLGLVLWLDIAGVSVQPSEIAKLLTVILAAWLFTTERFRITRWRSVGLMLLLTGIPGFLIFREPNLSTALTLVFGVFVVAFAAGLRLRVLLIGIIAIAVAAPIGYSMLRPYHKARIHVFLNPEADPLNKGWNQRQSELAVGSGGFSGKGFMQGTQNQLGYLPQTVSNSDFIFSVIAEETGFLGSALLMLAYTLLMISIFRTALIAPDGFGRCLCAGLGAVLALHTIVNVGMSIRLMPVTGLPLPLVSYGGTFMLATLSCLGIVQSVYARRNLNGED